jgi:surfactin synthase thioesterase subunit
MFSSRPQIGEYADYVFEAVHGPQSTVHSKNKPEEDDSQTAIQTPALIQRHFNPKATTRLFCFHDAGGSASLYQGWEGYLGETVELVTVELPGRGGPRDDKTYSQLAPLLEDLKSEIMPLLNMPYVFFGHSMGGMLAFELTHALRDAGHRLPVILCLSSTPGLATYTADQVNPLRSDEMLTHTFPHLKAARGDDKIYTLLLHVLRTDLTLICNYNYIRKDPLDVPFVVVHGQDDPRVTADQARAWRSETTAHCTILSRPGGHRYITGDVPFITARVREWLGRSTVHSPRSTVNTNKVF